MQVCEIAEVVGRHRCRGSVGNAVTHVRRSDGTGARGAGARCWRPQVLSEIRTLSGGETTRRGL
jgi:hypothetical protein